MEFNNEAVSLHARLQIESARKKRTHLNTGKRNKDTNDLGAIPSRSKLTMLKSNRSKARLKAEPALGSIPSRRTDRSTTISRNEKKKPTRNATPVDPDGILLELSTLIRAELENS